ncbi:thioesterase family protein [Plantactinospora sp. B5E13]|uniref:acyl-CoA thioesterase n=1 Tax=unclassified Plantactinospora TaxID=2631981 RepID=UPI00325F2950
MAEPASIVTSRRLEWSETDPADRWHYGAVLRFVESAETLLHHRLGVPDADFRRMVRVNLTVDYLGSLHFGEVGQTTLAVEDVGRTSLRYAFHVARDGTPLARGTLTVVLLDPATGRGAPWPDRLRTLLTQAGPQEG